MDRIRQALDRARLERAHSQRSPWEPLQLSYLQLAEFAEAAGDAQLRADDHSESPPLPEAAELLDAVAVGGDRALRVPEAIHEQHAVQQQDAAQEPYESHLQAVDVEPTQGMDLDNASARPMQAEMVVWENSQTDPQGESSALDRLWGLIDSHPSSYAPLLVSLVLGILIATDLARAARLLSPATPTMAQAALLVRSSPHPQRAVIDVNGIVAAHLFGETADPNIQDPAHAPQTAANLLLAGTLAAENPKRGLAIIGIDGRSTMYRVGDTVADGELHSVYRDRVVLRRHGILETLVFPKLRLAKNSAGSSSAAPADRTAAVTERPTARRSAGDLFQGTSSFADGKFRGFRISPAGSNKEFVESGLRPGDLVVAVNGASLEGQDQQSAQEIFNSMKNSSQANLTVINRGTRREITINSSHSDPGDTANE